MFGIGKRKQSRKSVNTKKMPSIPPNIKLTEEQRKALMSSAGIGKITDHADPSYRSGYQGKMNVSTI